MSAKDRKRFAQYLHFEPFNGQQRLVDLYDLVLAHSIAEKRPKSSWEESLMRLGIAETQIHKQLTFLHQKLDQFLSIEEIMATPHRHLSYTLAAYNARNVEYATAEKKWRQLSKRLQSEPASTEHLHEMLNLEHYAIEARLKAQIEVDGSYFEEMHRLIDQHYLLCKLKYCCAAVNEAQLLKLPFPAALVAQVQAFQESYVGDLPPFGQAYKSILDLQMAESQPLAAYEQVLADLMRHVPAIDRDDNTDLFNYFLNLCYRRLDVGEPGFEALVAGLYGQLMEMNLLFEEEIPSRIYRNIVSLYCRQRLFDACNQFIDGYGPKLQGEDRHILPKFCKGLVYNYQGDYVASAAIFRAIIQANPDDHLWAFESRTLLLKAYFYRYETLNQEEHDELYRLMDSFKMFVRRNTKLDHFHQQCYLNFIQYFSLLLRHVAEQGRRGFPETLRQTIIEEKNVTNKAWLLGVFSEKI